MTYTKRSPSEAFPACLMVVLGDTPLSENMRDVTISWMKRHNAAITKFAAGLTEQPNKGEQTLLNLAKSIYLWTRQDILGEEELGYFDLTEVALPMIDAFRAMLNYDTGRLDAGTLDSWIVDLAAKLEIDLDVRTIAGQEVK